MMRAALVAILALVACRAGAQTLSADLSSHLIAITTGFTGASVVLFGTTDAPGDVIASLSDTEGAKPQLYFEIREGRKTVDPKLWLKRPP